jgi:TrmH family RNA methyltransferase
MPKAKHQFTYTPQNIVKQLRQLRTPAERARTGVFYAEGARIVAKAIESGAEIVLGVISRELLQGEHAHKTVEALRATGSPVIDLNRAAFESISFKENLQGIGAVVLAREETLAAVAVEQAQLWVALDNVGNPGNLGAVMRTCDAVGCAGLILLGKTVDPYHPAAIRASMGSFFALRMVRTSFPEFIAWKTAHHYTVIGTTPDVQQEYREVRYPPACILLMGSERLGLSAQQQQACDVNVRIPMVGTVDSLNLGVATSIVLYEIFHQNRNSR